MAGELPRRRIEELLAIYRFEPAVADVFTEGDFDRRVIKCFVEESVNACGAISVYPIDHIDVSRVTLAKHGLNVGNRSEVLALCCELEASFGKGFRRACGVVDRDFETFLAADPQCGLVFRTDFSCLEMYLCEPRCLQRALNLAFPRVPLSAAELIVTIMPILVELFLIRFANVTLNLALTWLEIERFCSMKRGVLNFDREDYVRSYLAGGASTSRRQDFDNEVARLRALLNPDDRFQVNGHDFTALLSVIFRSFGSKAADREKARPDAISVTLVCCLSSAEISYPMFRNLAARLHEALASEC